jgi:ABC-type sugar transport system permease subunit
MTDLAGTNPAGTNPAGTNPAGTNPARTVLTSDAASQRRLAYWLIAPAVFLMLAVTAYPIVYAVWLSLHRYNLASPADTRFVGPTSTGGQPFSSRSSSRSSQWLSSSHWGWRWPW